MVSRTSTQKPVVLKSHDTNSIGARSREQIVSTDMCPPLTDVRIATCGISDARAGFTFERHEPIFGQVLMTCDGEGRALLNGQWQTLRRGMAYVTPQGVPHAYHAVPGKSWRVVWTHYVEGPSPTTITCAAPSVLHVNPQPLLSALSGLYFEATGDADIDVMTHWVHLIHTNVVRLNEAWDDRNATWHIWEKVAADLGHPWTVAELAGMACMSGESFRLWCRRSNGRSPLEHVTFLRMRRATDVLRRTDQKLEVIARWLGYENVFAFSRAFKRWIGMPPAHFRNAATSRHALQHPGAAKPGGESRP